VPALKAQTFRGGDSWCGNPDLIQPAENPYVQLAELNVTRALESKHAFWLTWGYVAVESLRKGDATLRDKAMAAMDALVAKELEKKVNLWELTESMETLYLWKKDGTAPTERYTKWLADLAPMVQKNYDMNEKGEYWESVASNTLHQSAVVLKLASILYDKPVYADMAAKLIVKARLMQNDGGAFNYMRQSGPTPLYFGFEVTFLGRYYMLTHDPDVAKSLKKMALFAHDALSNGMWDAASTPWWKHVWHVGGPMHGIEIAAGMARDPIARALAAYRLPSQQPYTYSYVSMYFWDPTIPVGQLGGDLCKFNTNYGGPHLRSNGWQVVMPGKAYLDTAIGAAVVRGKERYAFDAYLETAAIDVVSPGNIDKPYARPNGAYMVVPAQQIDNHRGIVGENWIASAHMFEPRMPYYGNAGAPPSKGWHTAQVWFADNTALAGWMLCWKDDKAITAIPRGYLSLGNAPVISNDSHIAAGMLNLQVFGSSVHRITTFDTTHLWVDFAPDDPSAIAKGKWLGYGLAGWPDGEKTQQIARIDHASLLAVQVQQANGKWATLLLNPTSQTQSMTLASNSKTMVWRCQAQGENDSSKHSESLENMSVAAGELVVIPDMTLIGVIENPVMQ
jgi:hypothetical protein